MLYHMRAWCRYTRGRFESTHGGVLDGHTEAFLNVHTGTPHTPLYTDRETQRQRQRETEKERQDKKRKEKSRREKTREEEEKIRDERKDQRRRREDQR